MIALLFEKYFKAFYDGWVKFITYYSLFNWVTYSRCNTSKVKWGYPKMYFIHQGDHTAIVVEYIHHKRCNRYDVNISVIIFVWVQVWNVYYNMIFGTEFIVAVRNTQFPEFRSKAERKNNTVGCALIQSASTVILLYDEPDLLADLENITPTSYLILHIYKSRAYHKK